jgi:uncharacterized protein
MILETRIIPEGRSVISQDTELDAVKADLPEIINKIKCKAEVDRSGQNLYVHLWFEGSFKLECSRCLQSLNYELKGETRVIVRERPGSNGVATDDESADFYFDTRNDQVDLSPAIYDEIMTNLPLKPLCRTDCKGIPVEGVVIELDDEVTSSRRNVADEIDPRWEALKRLKK